MIDFDPAKDAANLKKHGISLAAAEELFAGETIETIDHRQDYGEVRRVAIGEIQGRLFVCVYTWRGEQQRVISLRPAKRKERDVYREKTGKA